MPQGVYVLLTTDGARIAPLDCYDDLFDGYAPNMVRYINLNVLNRCFSDSATIPPNDALVVAQSVAKVYNELADGIRVISDYRKFSFEELKNGSASKD